MCKSLMRKSIAVALAFLAASVVGASAQSYPDRSIKVVVPYPAGGPTDTIARTVTQSLGTALGQSIVIENQAGAGGRIAMKQVANSAPDGYTLLLGGTNNNAITPAVYKDLPKPRSRRCTDSAVAASSQPPTYPRAR